MAQTVLVVDTLPHATLRRMAGGPLEDRMWEGIEDPDKPLCNQSGFLSWCLGCQLRLPWGSSSSFAIQRCPSFVIQRLEENMFVIVRHEEIRRDSEVVRHEEIRRRNSGAGRGGGDCNCKVRNTLIVRVWCCKISTIGDETHRGVVVVVCRDQEFL